MYIERTICRDIEKHLFQGKIIVIYGPRRVGKTTLAKHICEEHKADRRILYLVGDDLEVQKNLSSQKLGLLKNYIGNANLIVVDEAQRIENIGINLKLIVDNLPDVQIIATGSSSFDLSDKIKEPLTGRTWEYFLPPFTMGEIQALYSRQESYSVIDNFIRFGFYPDIITGNGQETQRHLQQITGDYLFKDVLSFEGEKNSGFVHRLLQLLAFQIGNEVSANELAVKLGVSRSLVEKFIDLLIRCYIIFKISPFSRNLRNEVGKKHKIFFWDIGIRNALIQNFSDLDIRPDIGFLWENFCIAERLKMLKTNMLSRNIYYWRTYDQKEIDYLEEYDGKLHGYEIKWGNGKLIRHKDFLSTYKNSDIRLINRDNFRDFVISE